MGNQRKYLIDPLQFLAELNLSKIHLKHSDKAVLLLEDQAFTNIVKGKFQWRSINYLTSSALIIHENVILCYNFGIGSPATVDIAEQLIALGVNEIVIVGTAGAISSDLNHGDIVVCNKAFIDEGTSRHYIPGKETIEPDAKITGELIDLLKNNNISYCIGSTWTTDAPFMESVEDVKKYQSLYTLTVDMEASALFTVGAFRGIKTAALFVISDLLGKYQWVPGFDKRFVKERQLQLTQAVIEFLIAG